MDCRMKSSTICCRWVSPCTVFSVLNTRIRVKEGRPDVENLRRSRDLLLGLGLPLGEELPVEGIAVAGLAAVVLLVEALQLVDEVVLHPLAEHLLVGAVDELHV